MTVRAKFKCDGNNVGSVSLSPVYGDNAENKKFFAATPSGSIHMNVLNPSASAQFKEGVEYYVDFTEVPKPVVETAKEPAAKE